jgi:hypothetical protein
MFHSGPKLIITSGNIFAVCLSAILMAECLSTIHFVGMPAMLLKRMPASTDLSGLRHSDGCVKDQLDDVIRAHLRLKGISANDPASVIKVSFECIPLGL